MHTKTICYMRGTSKVLPKYFLYTLKVDAVKMKLKYKIWWRLVENCDLECKKTWILKVPYVGGTSKVLLIHTKKWQNLTQSKTSLNPKFGEDWWKIATWSAKKRDFWKYVIWRVLPKYFLSTPKVDRTWHNQKEG